MDGNELVALGQALDVPGHDSVVVFGNGREHLLRYLLQYPLLAPARLGLVEMVWHHESGSERPDKTASGNDTHGEDEGKDERDLGAAEGALAENGVDRGQEENQEPVNGSGHVVADQGRLAQDSVIEVADGADKDCSE